MFARSPECQLQRESRKTKEVLHFDPSVIFQEYYGWRGEMGRSAAQDTAKWRIFGELSSLRQEATGESQVGQLVTKIQRTFDADGNLELKFQNPLYKKGADLKQMYQQSLVNFAGYQRWRFALENTQMVKICDTLSECLLSPEKELEPWEIIQKEGFEQTHFPLSANLAALFPNSSLRTKYAEYQKNQLKTGEKTPPPTVEMYVGKTIVTTSTQSPVHGQGKTSFNWISRLVYIPEVNEFVILQDGNFSAFAKEESKKFLQFKNEKPPASDTEEELMLFLNILSAEFKQQHAEAIFAAIIDEIGYFKKAPLIDTAILKGEVDVLPYIDFFLKVFDWEYNQCHQNSQMWASAGQRILMWSEMIEHQLMRKQKTDVEIMFKEYVEMFSNPIKATNPIATTVKEEFRTRVARNYADFQIPIDLSKLDCVAGSIRGGLSQFSAQMEALKAKGGMLEVSGNEQKRIAKFLKASLERIAQKRKTDIRNRRELKEFCDEFGMDESTFHAAGWQENCRMCGNHYHYLGLCNVCAFCNAEDNLRGLFADDLGELLHENDAALGQSSQDMPVFFTLNDLVASFLTPEAVGKNLFMETQPEVGQLAA